MDSLQKSHMPRSRRPGQGTWTKQRTRVRLATRAMVNTMFSSVAHTPNGRETRSRVQVTHLFNIGCGMYNDSYNQTYELYICYALHNTNS